MAFSRLSISILVATTVIALLSAHTTNACFTCDQVAACTSETCTVDPNTGLRIVTLDITGCKDGGNSFSHACLWDADAMISCPGGEQQGKKCNDFKTITYSVDPSKSTVKFSIKDGQIAGEVVDCANDPIYNCGGGSGSCGNACGGGSASSICGYEVNLDELCGDGGDKGDACSAHIDCSFLNVGCSAGVCVNGVCQQIPKSAGDVCRASVGICDAPEVCDGVNLDCPADSKESTDMECRPAAGICDVPDYCDGVANDCVAADEKAGTDMVCRPAAGICDVPDYCDGVANDCVAADEKAGTDMECRPAAGICDVPDYCDGVANDCVADDKAGTDVVCRPSVGICDADDVCDGISNDCGTDIKNGPATTCRASAGVCDVPEVCDGVSDKCGNDTFKSADTVCRTAVNICDINDHCPGDSSDCTEDVKKTVGYTYKCATTGYLCGPEEYNLSIIQRNSHIGGCNMGRLNEIITLEWPACENQCINVICLNGRGVSNYEMLSCTDEWVCDEKVEVEEGVTPFPVCRL